MKHLFLSLGLVAASAFSAHADTWTTTEPNGTQNRTIVGRPDVPARDYSRDNSRTFQPSKSHTITQGAQIPDNVNRMREPRYRGNSNLTVGRWVPYYYPSPYGYYPQPVYPAPVYTYPPSYTPLAPGAGIVTGGGTVYGNPYVGNPYGYYPQPAYPGGGYYPYVQGPSWNFYGYSGPATGGYSGSYNSQTNSSYGGLSVGRGGVRANIGGGRTTTSSSYSTFP